MTIAFQDAFAVLAVSMPKFKVSASEWDERLAYPLLSDMVRWICNRAHPEFPDFEKFMQRFADILEKLISRGDNDIQDLVRYGLNCLREYKEGNFVAAYFKPKTHEMWQRISVGEHCQ
jgi:hypothetical protein